MKMQKISWALVVILGISTGFMAYKFILSGSVEQTDDGRLAIQLTASERDLVLSEMRTFLDSVQQITQGVANNDLAAAAKAAQIVGRAAQQSVPGTLIGKLPLEFKKMGFDTHSQFSQLALDAEQLGDGAHTIEQLGTLLQNCVACHAIYKFEATKDIQ
jgi:mono/diheme cytochrome c family protein